LILPAIVAAAVGWYLWMRRRTLLSGDDTDDQDTINRSSYNEYVHNDDTRGNKANRILGQDLELDPPSICNERFLKASAAELDSTPLETHELPETHSELADTSTIDLAEKEG
jgi:hypothetical protein